MNIEKEKNRNASVANISVISIVKPITYAILRNDVAHDACAQNQFGEFLLSNAWHALACLAHQHMVAHGSDGSLVISRQGIHVQLSPWIGQCARAKIDAPCFVKIHHFSVDCGEANPYRGVYKNTGRIVRSRRRITVQGTRSNVVSQT